MPTANNSLSYPQPPPPSLDQHLLAPKRTYLALLPPPQVIEICMTFEAYAPPHVKGIIWPTDLNSAIAALQAQQTLSTAMRNKPGESSSEPTAHPTSSSDPQPQPPFTHHPYGYAHTPPAYPHAPYHMSPYVIAPGTSYPPGFPHAPANPFSPQTATVSSDVTADDLPSYEEMIVEALKDFNDPEGSQPKTLFSWMASHYPLQTNFRPSASQALQKAFKRGRLEKTSGGRYKLNVSWEGGSTCRRTTRRPQTHTQTTIVVHSTPPTPSVTSPFTHVPRALPTASSTSQNHPPSTSAGPPGEDRDAWEAAQSILKAINFGGLLKLPDESDNSPETAGHADHIDSSSIGANSADSKTAEGRAELQAQLALLAAQLAEIAQGATVGVAERQGKGGRTSADEIDMES